MEGGGESAVRDGGEGKLGKGSEDEKGEGNDEAESKKGTNMGLEMEVSTIQWP